MGDLLMVVLCGFGVGWLAGLLGVGGSFLLVPILHVVLDIQIDKAVGSTACQLLGPATAAVLAPRGLPWGPSRHIHRRVCWARGAVSRGVG